MFKSYFIFLLPFFFIISIAKASIIDTIPIEVKLSVLWSELKESESEITYDYSILYQTEAGFNFIREKVESGEIKNYKGLLQRLAPYWGAGVIPLLQKEDSSYNYNHYYRIYLSSNSPISIANDKTVKEVEEHIMNNLSDSLVRYKRTNTLTPFAKNFKFLTYASRHSSINVIETFIENLDRNKSNFNIEYREANKFLNMIKVFYRSKKIKNQFLLDFLRKHDFYKSDYYPADWVLKKIIETNDPFFIPHLKKVRPNRTTYKGAPNEEIDTAVDYLLAREKLGDLNFTFKEKKWLKEHYRFIRERKFATEEFIATGTKHRIKYNRKARFKKYKKIKNK